MAGSVIQAGGIPPRPDPATARFCPPPPLIQVKGGDYKPEEIAGYAEVTANGGEVRVLNFEDGCSTTDIIKTIRERG